MASTAACSDRRDGIPHAGHGVIMDHCCHTHVIPDHFIASNRESASKVEVNLYRCTGHREIGRNLVRSLSVVVFPVWLPERNQNVCWP